MMKRSCSAFGATALVMVLASCTDGGQQPSGPPSIDGLSLDGAVAVEQAAMETSAATDATPPRVSAREDDPPDDVAAMPWELISIGEDDRSAVIRYLPSIACYREAGIWALYGDDGVLLAPLAEDLRSLPACSLADRMPVTVEVGFSEELAGRELRSLPIDDELTAQLDRDPRPAISQ